MNSLDWVVRHSLLLAIRYYRKHLSQRGPLRGVCCTFGKLESCSAFAERITTNVPACTAVVLILARLSRCRHFSIFRVDGNRLGWGRGFDAVLAKPRIDPSLSSLNQRLAQRGELRRTRRAILQAAGALVLGHGLGGSRSDHKRLAIRDAVAVRRRSFTRMARATALALLFVVLTVALLQLQLHLSALVAACLMVWACASACNSYRSVQRLDRVQILARLESPLAR